MLGLDDNSEVCVLTELIRRWRVDQLKFTSEEHRLFADLYEEEYQIHHVDGKDWEPKALKDAPERAFRYRYWVDEFIGLPIALSGQYGDDYQAEVTEVLRHWKPSDAAKLMRVSEEEAAERLESALSDRWKAH